jgi:DNA-binding GntR family transcriptional regulator
MPPARGHSEPAPADEQADAEVNASEERLRDAITRSLLGGRLAPGTPLRERYLAQEFGVTRGAVRKVLAQLAQDGLLELHPNRGAFVPEPQPEEIRRAYEARIAVESGMVALLAESITAQQLSSLRSHVREEHRAGRKAERAESVTLSGDFHVVLAELFGNPLLVDIVQRLVRRTQVFVAVFEPSSASVHSPEEHEAVVSALAKRDGAAAVDLMTQHLRLVQQRVLAYVEKERSVPVAHILREAMKGDR